LSGNCGLSWRAFDHGWPGCTQTMDATMLELTPVELLKRAMRLQQAGDLAQADGLCRKIPRRNKYYGEALRLRGLIARQRGDTDKAIKLARRAVEQAPSNAVFHHTLAQLLRSVGRYAAAVTSYRRAWKLLPERDETGADLADCLARAGRVDE